MTAIDENAAVTRSQWNMPLATPTEVKSKEQAVVSADAPPSQLMQNSLKPQFDESETSSRFSKIRNANQEVTVAELAKNSSQLITEEKVDDVSKPTEALPQITGA